MDKRFIGSKGEELAAQYLTQNGMYILERNFHCNQGEIDIIGRHKEYLVFVEVKYRTSDKFGSPEAAVGFTKQRKICRVADYYRMIHSMGYHTGIRYDVLAIQGSKIQWYQNAFPHQN